MNSDERGHLRTASLSPNPYSLLIQYKKEATILSNAYKMNEAHYRQMSKTLTYPVILLSASASVIAGLRNPDLEYVLLGITLATLLFSGFNTAVNPKDREHASAKVSNEFSEIASAINQFVTENSKSNDEIKAYSRRMLAILDVWRSLAPPISNAFIEKATIDTAVRVPRNSLSGSLKKKAIEINNNISGVIV
jgi:hypothetical protein